MELTKVGFVSWRPGPCFLQLDHGARPLDWERNDDDVSKEERLAKRSMNDGGDSATAKPSIVPKAAKSGGADVGAALRNAFCATVDEKVPDEMLDLLRRLN